MHRWLASFFGPLLVSLALCPAAWAATYTLDQAHSTVGFRVRHLLSYTQGTFNDYAGSFEYDPDHPERWSATATIQTASIDTRVDKRDAHLRSADFFDAEKFPTITFTSTHVTDATAATAKLHGTLSMHGVEKPAVLDVVIHGVAADPWGTTRSGFTATTTINRKDFGVTWNKTLDTGQVLVGEDIEVTIEIEGILKQ